MGKKSPKIKPTKVPRQSDLIKPTPIKSDDKVSFNFRRLTVKIDGKDSKFDYTCCEQKYFNTLLERLKHVSNMSRHDLTCAYNNKTLRCHPIDFANDKRLSEHTFGITEEVDKDAWQFQLSQSEHGRVHGYFVENNFYVVWLDPKHQLYSK